MENIEDSFELYYTDKVIAPEFTLIRETKDNDYIEVNGDAYFYFRLVNEEKHIDLHTDVICIEEARVDIKNGNWRIYPCYSCNNLEYDIVSHEIRSVCQ